MTLPIPTNLPTNMVTGDSDPAEDMRAVSTRVNLIATEVNSFYSDLPLLFQVTDDFNTLPPGVVMILGNAVTNRPTGSGSGLLETFKSSDLWYQRFGELDAPKIWTRFKSGGVWQPWRSVTLS